MGAHRAGIDQVDPDLAFLLVDSDGQTEVRKGLQVGQRVVVSGQFLVDSEANLKATVTRMGELSASDAPVTGDPSRIASPGPGTASGAKP